MKAQVKQIPDGERADTHEHSDTFCEPEMRPGEFINVEPMPGCPGWFQSESRKSEEHGWNYHESWLIFKGEKK